MKLVLIILAVALVLKDISQLNDPYIMRGIAQLLCLFVGGMWFLSNITPEKLKKYWPILFYFLILFVSIPFTSNPVFITFQVVSLFAVVIFSISYFESARSNEASHKVFINSTVYMYFIACVLSLVIIPLLPGKAFDVLYGGEIRFRGLFSKSGMIATAGGILFGLALFGFKSKIKVFKYSMATVGMICVGITLSRTFWVASIVASLFTMYLYFPKYKKYQMLAIGVFAFFAFGIMAFNVKFDVSSAEEIARVDSITSLSGRLSLWQTSVSSLEGYRWVIGHGFTAGSEGLNLSSDISDREKSKTTLHNGYVQSLLDSGVLGLAFYMLTIVLSILKLIKKDKSRAYPYLFYVLVFMAVANFGEAVIYSASVYHSLVFWIAAVASLGLIENAKVSAGKVEAGVEHSHGYQSVRLKSR